MVCDAVRFIQAVAVKVTRLVSGRPGRSEQVIQVGGPESDARPPPRSFREVTRPDCVPEMMIAGGWWLLIVRTGVLMLMTVVSGGWRGSQGVGGVGVARVALAVAWDPAGRRGIRVGRA
jgi:hypothetical protein